VPTEESGLARSARNNANLKSVDDVDVDDETDADADAASVSTVAPELEVGLTEETTSPN